MLYETEYNDMLREFYRSEWPELKSKMNEVIDLVRKLLDMLIKTRIARQIYDVTPTKQNDNSRYDAWCKNRQLYHTLMRTIHGFDYDEDDSDEENELYPEYALLEEHKM